MVNFGFNSSIWDLFASSPEGGAWIQWSEALDLTNSLQARQKMGNFQKIIASALSVCIKEMGLGSDTTNDIFNLELILNKSIDTPKKHESPRDFFIRQISRGIHHKTMDYPLCYPEEPLA